MRPAIVACFALASLGIGIFLGGEMGQYQGMEKGKLEERARWHNAAITSPFLHETSRDFYYVHRWNGEVIVWPTKEDK